MKINRKLTSAIVAALSAQATVVYAAEPSAPQASGAIEEIIVTAQRREETVQNVPITIQAITGEQLAQLNVTSFDDAVKLLPNVQLGTNGPGQGNIYMRGLSAGMAGNQSMGSVAPFPNVAVYLDDQSMTFPARNADVYMVDMERLEVLEGPQGTLFGGGAEAGAIRYITNKPKQNVTEGYASAMYGTTAHGDPNTAVSGTINLPLVKDTLALRLVMYNDRRGGYIDNVPSTFTRKVTDNGPAAYGSTYPANVLGVPSANNYAIAARAQNPTTYEGMRASLLYDINEDWNLLIQQSYQNLDAEGMSAQFPVGSDGQQLGPWEVTAFSPNYNKDRYSSTAWTLNGKVGDFKGVYTGSYLTRHIEQAMDYTNYARTAGGFYYTCVGGPAGSTNFGAPGPQQCYSPVSSWTDLIETTHQSHELRVSSPDDWRLRGLVGAYWEQFEIKDDMNFLYKSIPSCTPANLAAALAGGPICIANMEPTPGTAAIDPSIRNDAVAYGQDLRRGYKQTAFFASVDFDLIPKVLVATAGTRHFNYNEDEFGSNWHTGEVCQNVANGACVFHNRNINDNATYSGFRNRFNLTWHVTTDAMVYATASQGFRPGAFNRFTSGVTKIYVDAAGNPYPNGVVVPSGTAKVAQFSVPSGYPPDTLTNYELGWKTEWLDHRLQINGSAYRMYWKDVQTLIYNPPVYGNGTFGVKGPEYKVDGFELQFVGRVTEGFTLQGAWSHNSSSQDNSPCITSSYVAAAGGVQNPTPIGTCISQVTGLNANNQKVNIQIPSPLGSIGSTPAFSPKNQYNLRARYEWSVSELKNFFSVSANHIDEMDNEPSSFNLGPAPGTSVPTTTWLRYMQPGYTTYDLSIGTGKGPWTVEAFAQNLTNVNASMFTSTSQFIVAEVPTRPRVLGVKLGVKF